MLVKKMTHLSLSQVWLLKFYIFSDGSDDGGVESKLTVISLTLIEVDGEESAKVADEDMELFATLDVAVAVVAVVAVAATLRAARILFFLL